MGKEGEGRDIGSKGQREGERQYGDKREGGREKESGRARTVAIATGACSALRLSCGREAGWGEIKDKVIGDKLLQPKQAGGVAGGSAHARQGQMGWAGQ